MLAAAGVIFLLFGLGLEFSFRKLARVGVPAAVTAVVEVACMLGFGFLAGRLMGWSNMDSLFLGGVLSISSTTIIIRAFEELGLKRRGFASLVFGVLIVEDVVAILLLVLLSTVAATKSLESVVLMSTAVMFWREWWLSQRLVFQARAFATAEFASRPKGSWLALSAAVKEC